MAITKARGATYVTIYPDLSALVYLRSQIQGLTYLQCRDELRQGDNEEVEIEKELELLVECKREESRNRVFLIANYIRWIWGFATYTFSVDSVTRRRELTCGTEGYCP